MKTLFCYDEKLGLAGCSVIYKGLVFTGVAICHPDDRDFMSERTGCFIAESRALIKCKQHIKKNEIEPGLAALRQAMSCMKQGKNYNPNSYEAKSLWKQIHTKEKELNLIKQELVDEKQYLNEYIKNKDIVHNKLRNRANQVKDN